MKLTDSDLHLLAQCAISAACQAGHLINARRQTKLDIHSKESGDSLASSVLTEVDLLSEKLILSVLEPTLERFDLALLAEETADDRSRLEKDYFWCIDPIDGTLPFTESTPGFSVSIGLVAKDGTPMIGVIFDPLTHNLYHALKGQGAFLNNETWEVASNNSRFTFINDRSFTLHPQFSEVITAFKEMAQQRDFNGFNTKLHGGGAMNACWVLEHAPACYFKLPRKKDGGGSLWDYAASSCIFSEAGGIVCDFAGNPPELNRPDSTYMNHKGLIFASDPEIARFIMEYFT